MRIVFSLLCSVLLTVELNLEHLKTSSDLLMFDKKSGSEMYAKLLDFELRCTYIYPHQLEEGLGILQPKHFSFTKLLLLFQKFFQRP
jgi:hypothetical protein